MRVYPRYDKRRLYWLIDQYLAGKIDESSFCDEYYYSHDLEVGKETLNDVERNTFKELSMVAGRFSNYESDFKMAPGVFFTKEELRDTIVRAKEALDQQVGVRSYDVELNLISAYWCHEVASSNEDRFDWAYEEIQGLAHEISEVSLQTLVALAMTAPNDYLMAIFVTEPLEDYINLVVKERRQDQADFIADNPYLKKALPDAWGKIAEFRDLVEKPIVKKLDFEPIDLNNSLASLNAKVIMGFWCHIYAIPRGEYQQYYDTVMKRLLHKNFRDKAISDLVASAPDERAVKYLNENIFVLQA